jgi:hypothetical protein
MTRLSQLNKYPGVFYEVFCDGFSHCAYIIFSGRKGNYEHLNRRRLLIIDDEFASRISYSNIEQNEALNELYDSNIQIPTDYWKYLLDIDLDIYPGNTTVYLKEAGYHQYRDFNLPEKFKTPEYMTRYRLCKTKIFDDDKWILTRKNDFLSISEMNEQYGFELKDIYHEYNENRRADNANSDDGLLF